ncbi:hypothetical protein D3C83_211450 [compost metagenome]
MTSLLPKAELIMRRIYDVSPTARGQEMLKTILQAAYAQREPAGKFASKLFLVCMSTGGNMDEVLGVTL